MNAKRDIVGYLRAHVGLFAGFTDDRLRELVDASAVRSFETNEELMIARHTGALLGRAVARGAAARS